MQQRRGPWPPDYYTLFARTEWQRQFASDYEWAAYVVPVYEHASESTSRAEDWDLGLGIVVRRQVRSILVGVGVDWNEHFGSKFVIPVLEFTSERSRFRFQALLPLEATAQFRWTPWMEVGVMALQQGGEYRTDDQEVETDEWVKYWSTTVGPNFVLTLVPGVLCLEVQGGFEFWRHFDGGSPASGHTKSEFEPSPSVEISVQYGRTWSRHEKTRVWGWN